MASHFKLDERIGEVVPWMAKYHYPTQASRAWKNVTKIPPRNGSSGAGFGPGDRISFVLPAQGYINPSRVLLQFDANLTCATTNGVARFQNNINSIFHRATLSYGGLVIEDLQRPNVLTRILTEGASSHVSPSLDQASINEGVGGMLIASDEIGVGYVNARAAAIQSSQVSADDLKSFPSSCRTGATSSRRYSVGLPFGLFQQNKLIPAKWMAPQISMDYELAKYVDCVAQQATLAGGDTYTLTNVNLIMELLEFDGTYDEAFLDGLRSEGGVPIKFSSFNTYFDQCSTGTAKTVMIAERYRSIKAALTVILPPPKASVVSKDSDGNATGLVLPYDSHAFLQSSTGITTGLTGGYFGHTEGNLQSYQYRIGGKYYPNQPVSFFSSTGYNGGVEAFDEFAKALNTLGDYRMNLGVNAMRWSPSGNAIDWFNTIKDTYAKDHLHGPSCFVISASFETSDGSEISGLNGEEQNDIALQLSWNTNQDANATIVTFTYYDALLILRDNNIAEIIK